MKAFATLVVRRPLRALAVTATRQNIGTLEIFSGAAFPCRAFSSKPTLQDRLLESTENIFKTQSTPALLKTSLLFDLISVKPLVDACVKLLSAELQSSSSVIRGLASVAAAPLRLGIYYFFFRVFTGGETIEEATKVIATTRAQTGVRAIMDHSTEEFEDPEYWDLNLRKKVDLVRQV